MITTVRSLTVAVLLACVPLAHAQPAASGGGLEGVVTDESGAPLSGVTVTLEGQGEPRSTTTGGAGEYAFSGLQPGAYRASASLLGFAREQAAVSVSGPGTTARASFVLLVLALDQLVASASKAVRTVREAPATVYVVTEAMIRERGYSYLYDALRDAPGLDIVWMGGLYGPILMPRGLDSQENNKLLLLVDGVVDNNLSAGTAQVYMQYSLHNVKRIEIIYGPASALYGANAMGGLINIITRTGADIGGVRAQLGGMAWDPQGRRGGLMGNVSAGKVWGEDGRHVDVAASLHIVNTDGTDLRIDSDEARSDNPSNPGASNYYTGPDYVGAAENKTYMAQVRASFERFGVTLGGHIWQHNGGQGTYGHEGFVFLNGLKNRTDAWNFRNGAAWANWNRKFGDKLSNTLGVTYRDTKLTDGFDLYYDRTGTGPDGAGNPPASGSRYLRPDHATKVDDTVAWTMSPTMTLTFGASAEFQYVSDYQLATGHSFANQLMISEGPVPTVDDTRRYNYKDYGVFAEHAWQISDRLSLTTGLRFDAFKLTGDRTPFFFGTRDTDASGLCPANRPHCRTAEQAAAAGAVEVSRVYYLYQPYDKTRTSVNPRVGAVYSLLDKKLTLKALYGEGFRMPTIRELFSVSGSRFSNPDLGAEKIRTFEASGAWQLGGDRGLLELNLFHTKATDVMTLTPGTVIRAGRTSFLNQFQNVAQPRIYGFDLKGSMRATRTVEVFGHYSFQVPEYLKIDAGNRAHDPSTDLATDFTERIPRQAEHKGMLGAALNLWSRRLVVTPRVNIVGERPGVFTSPIQSVPSYASFNVSLLARDLGVKGLSATAMVYNLTNSDVLDPGFRTGNKANDFNAAHPQPGLHMYFKLAYSFQ